MRSTFDFPSRVGADRMNKHSDKMLITRSLAIFGGP